MQARKPKSEVNLLVLNYDRTAFTLYGTDRSMISREVIKFANSIHVNPSLTGNESDDDSELDCTNYEGVELAGLSAEKRTFDAFYGFTRRCVDLMYIQRNNLRNTLDRLHKENKATSYERSALDEAFLTSKITENLEKATGLHCRAVSTPDDMPNDKPLGTGYREMLEPWEKTGLDFKKMPDEHISLNVLRIKYPDNNQYRLTQIAQDAAKAYPEAKITLTFVNDDKKQCDEALKVPTTRKFNRKWPSNVRLDVYQHDATSADTSINFIGTAEKPRGLQQHGMFAPSHQMMTRGRNRTLEAPQQMRQMG